MEAYKVKFGKKNAEIEQKVKTSEEDLIGHLGIQGCHVPEGYLQIESYPLKAPFSYAWIFQEEQEGSFFYVVDELTMTKEEREAYKQLKSTLEYELKAPRLDETLLDSFHRQLPSIMADHQAVIAGADQVGLKKILYYLERDLIGFGKIDPIINDPYIEDISCLGINKPVFVWHRKYESARTNVIYSDEEDLDDFITRIVPSCSSERKSIRPPQNAHPMIGGRFTSETLALM